MAAKIYKALTQIMRQIGAIGKDSENTQQHYKFRSAEAVYNRVQPLMAKYGVISVPKVLDSQFESGTSKAGGTMHWARLTVQYTYYAEDGSSVEVIVCGEGMDSGDKATAKAMTVADRYAICQLLKIPYAVVDPESGSPEWANGLLNRITLKDLNELKAEWASRHPEYGTKEAKMLAFKEWATTTCDAAFDAGNWREWTDEDLKKCYEALESETSNLSA